jgi:transcriptional regulator of arginine metabolism
MVCAYKKNAFRCFRRKRILVFPNIIFLIRILIKINFRCKSKKTLYKKNWIILRNEYFCNRFEYLFIFMKARLQRQVAIRKIVSEKLVTSQEELLMLLKLEGFDLTQATLSRDMKALKVVKTPHAQGGYVYVLPQDQKVTTVEETSGTRFLSEGFLSFDTSGNIAVVKTKPAFASSIASLIDSAAQFEILGTIAGDDTIFMVLREGVDKRDLIPVLEGIMPNLKGKLI